MTIFQKMLVVPFLALFLFSGFLYYSQKQYQDSSERVKDIRDQYLPILDLTNENTRLFNLISTNFKDAVLAAEPSWLPKISQFKQATDDNLEQLAKYPDLVSQQQLRELKQSFELYYQNAHHLASAILNNPDTLLMEDTLVQNVEFYHNKTVSLFVDLKHSTHNRFIKTLDDTSAVMNQLLVIGSTISIGIVLFIVFVTLSISLLTRRKLSQVIDGMRIFSLGGTDFSRRLEYKSDDELGQLIYWFNKLSDKLEQDYKALETVSITDKLTQLNNRSRTDVYLPNALNQAQKQQTQIAVIMLDIDHFKSINDNYGHLIGDSVLATLAKILKQHATQHDYLSRWGGEEFLLILTNTSHDAAFNYAEALREKIVNHTFDEVGNVTASFGIALSQADDAQISIIKRADECLYSAKEQGRNRVIIFNEQ